ncbi:MAG: hypothetical protein L6V93_08670 [Clostridiales bacterium]|nr:MAG: hypothetical protein L6V93_08670 [Clostridiales bacterium]
MRNKTRKNQSYARRGFQGSIDALYAATPGEYSKFSFLTPTERSKLCDKSVDGIDSFFKYACAV